MRADVAHDAGAVERFLREARAAVALSSEHVARVIDVAMLESGAPYIVMEYLAGIDLSEVLRRGGPMAFSEAVGIVLQACEALAEAHRVGIVHRDLKPASGADRAPTSIPSTMPPNEAAAVVERALARALDAAAAAGRFDVVAQLARELEARRLARMGNVVGLGLRTARRID